MIAAARRVSYRILLQIVTSDAHSDELLRLPEVDALSPLDRNLTTTLVLGTLRWQLALDARIRALLHAGKPERGVARPEMKLSPEVATALRMGAYQLLHLERVPAHAVVHDSVELVKQGRERAAAGMVNAVLRGIQRSEHRAQSSGTDRPGGLAHRANPESEGASPEQMAARWAHPVWMVERWARRYGLEAAETICRWDQEPPALAVRADPGTELADIETEPGFFLSCARRVVRGDVSRSADLPPHHAKSGRAGDPGAFREGRVRIQDEASQLVAEVLADLPSRRARFAQSAEPDAAAGKGALRVLDLCAAPGGKTAVLAERQPEAEVTAVDVSRRRLTTMRALMPEWVRRRVRFEVADAAKMELKPEWDRILCDVPCSGTGTMARNPEIRLRVTEGDLARQHRRQAAILRAGLVGLRDGGRLVYSTCSLEPEENEAVVAEVLEARPGYRIVPVEGILDTLAERGVVTAEGRERLRTATEGPFLRTVPGVHPCDGFFAAVVEKAWAG
jgi:16S rRNA (cytosine967-C5)-methyltransferase